MLHIKGKQIQSRHAPVQRGESVVTRSIVPPDFSAARGECVEIMVNNVTVILVVTDTCKINTTCTSTYGTRTE